MTRESNSASSLGILLQDTARAWRLKLDQRLRPLGLSQAKWRTLLLVDRAGGGLTQTDLADRLGVEGPTLVRLLDRLEADGWLERRLSESDRRVKQVYLLSKADEMLRQIETVAAELREELLADIPAAELACCADVLRRIRARTEQCG
jgi:MarR family transcriptional regulator for hemolysin